MIINHMVTKRIKFPSTPKERRIWEIEQEQKAKLEKVEIKEEVVKVERFWFWMAIALNITGILLGLGIGWRLWR